MNTTHHEEVSLSHRTTIMSLVLGTVLAAATGLLTGSSCTRDQTGLLVLEWKVTSPVPDDPDPCATAGISQVEITVGRQGDAQSPPTFLFRCSDGVAKIPLPEGIYRVTLSEQTAGASLSVGVFDNVQVLGGTQRDWQGPYPPDPADAHTILLPWCGDGLIEGDELCDDATANSDTEPNACREDCRPAQCGDGVRDGGEQCDGAAMGDATCASLGFAAGDLGCRPDCRFDTTACLDARADLDVTWTVTSDGTTPSDCPSQGIARVHYELTDQEGRPQDSGYAPCLSGSVTLSDFPFGHYDVYLQGIDAQGNVVASAAAFNNDHSSLSGSTFSLTLVPSL